MLLTAPRDAFAFEDITGMPWIEIDFAVDVERAEAEILPRIEMAAAERRAGEAGKSSQDTGAATNP